MADTGRQASAIETAALQKRLALAGASGPQGLFKNIRVFGIAMFACLGGLLYGYNQGVFSGVLTMPNFQDHMGVYTSDQTKKGWLTSILELGAWFGVLLSGFFAEALGRKYAIIMFTLIFILGVVIQCLGATAAGAQAVLGGRFVVGLAIGPLSMTVPLYVAECAPPEIRGLLVGLQQLAIEFGILISFWIDYGTNFIGGTGASQSVAAWIVPLTLQLVPALILISGMTFMPFSPRWLVHHDREEDARKTLALLRNIPADSEVIEVELLEIKAQSLFEKRTVEDHYPSLKERTTWNTFKLQFVAILSLFKTKAMFRRVIVVCLCMTFQQFSGINAVLYYAPSIFANLGLSSNTTSLLATGVVGIVMFTATIPAILYIDKVGRRPILTAGAIGMGTCHMIIAIIYAKDHSQWATQAAAGWAAVVFVWMFAMIFGASWGPAAWILISEVWPISARPYGIALGASANWMNNFIVGQTTPDMLVTLQYGTFIFFGVMCFIGAAYIWFFVPETSRLSLEEMDTIFGSAGLAAADTAKFEAICQEIGLATVAHGACEKHGVDSGSDAEKEKSMAPAMAEANRSDDIQAA